MNQEGLMKKNTVASLLTAHDQIKMNVLKIFELIEKIKKIDEMSTGRMLVYDIHKCQYEWECCQKKVDYYFWQALLKGCLLTNVMTERNKDDFLRQMEQNTPEFCQEQIKALAQNIERLYATNYERTVREVYNSLIRCGYGGWRERKVDNLREVGKVFRCSGPICWEQFLDRFSYRFSRHNKINYEDLYLVCHLLDGKGQTNYDNKFEMIAEEAFKQGKDFVETEYFTVKCYKKGSQLVKWRPEKEYIRVLFNQIGSGTKALPDVMAKRYKKAHFDNGKGGTTEG